MDQMPSSMPPARDMPVSHTETTHTETKETKSLVSPQAVVRTKRPVFLWLIVVLLLAGTGFMGYVMYTQQNTLDAFQVSFTQWTNQVNSMQRNYDTSIKSLGDKLATVETSALAMQLDLDLMKTARTAEPTPEPTPSEEPDTVVEEPSSGEGAAGGTVLNEAGAYEMFLEQAKQGDKKTVQPDGITLVKSRQVSLDGDLTYNVFSSKANPDELYLYVQKLNNDTVFEDGWYGPFNLSTI